MKVLPKFLRGRSVFFWIILVQLIGFSLLTISVDFQPESIASWFERFADSPFGIPCDGPNLFAGSFRQRAAMDVTQRRGFGLRSCARKHHLPGSLRLYLPVSIFGSGGALGADRVNRMSGAHFGKFLKLVQQHGFWASLIVRIVPAGPIILVNLAAGVARIKYPAFLLGTAIGWHS